MSDLTSCYFCGTALDAPVERYPLTPPSLDVTTGRSVALCPTCRRKLVKVLEIVGAEFDAVADDAEDTASEEAATAGAPASAGDEADSADASADDADAAEWDTADTDTGDADAAEAEAPDDDDEAEDAAAEESEDATADEAGAPADEEADTDGAEPVGDEAEADTTTGDPLADDSRDGPAKKSDVDPVAATDPTAGDGGAATGADAAEGAGTGEDGESDAEASDDGGKPALLSTPAAQKVIKLLQNREFPLEREEFEIVASNAYDIPMQDCEDVIDTLVAEGYVAEDGAMLTRPA